VKTSRLSGERIARIDSGYQLRLESLMAVDEMIDVVVQRLDQHGALTNTYLFFLSDNGYFLGEHRQPHGKDAAYDAASRVPLIARGPGIAEGASVDKIALNIDLFPTIAELAGIATPRFVDGRSLVPLVTSSDRRWRDVALIEGFGKEIESNEGGETSTPAFRALRSEDILFAEYETGERELYDLRQDPYQIANIGREVSKSLLRDYSRRLDALTTCAGAECARLENVPIAKRSTWTGKRNGKQTSNTKDNRTGNVEEMRKLHRGTREQRRSGRVTASRDRDEASEAGGRRLVVGGPADATASLRLDIPPGAGDLGSLRLRIHVASVETGGTLVAALGTAESDKVSGSDHGSERLGSTVVSSDGWVSLDVSSALGDSLDLSIILLGRGGTELSLSGTASAKPPQLVSGAVGAESGQRDRPKRLQPENRRLPEQRENP
jgi:hypothetical protein